VPEDWTRELVVAHGAINRPSVGMRPGLIAAEDSVSIAAKAQTTRATEWRVKLVEEGWNEGGSTG